MNEETLNVWVSQYEASKTLPSKTIPCTAEGCVTETTAFGTNLAGKVAKATDIKTLLTTHKCRACKKAAKTTNDGLSDKLKSSIAEFRTRRTGELVKAATVALTETEVSTEDILSVFAEV